MASLRQARTLPASSGARWAPKSKVQCAVVLVVCSGVVRVVLACCLGDMCVVTMLHVLWAASVEVGVQLHSKCAKMLRIPSVPIRLNEGLIHEAYIQTVRTG